MNYLHTFTWSSCSHERVLVNCELLVENLQEKILSESCFVYSSVKSDANHFSELSFPLRLKQNVQEARMQYQLYLEDQRKLHAR